MTQPIKHAAADAAETQLESTFADIANARLRDIAPSLVPTVVGFQMVDCSDKGDKAVGLFGCEIGEKYFYIPSFFLNGELKSMTSIYSPDSDLFVPLTDDWVNELLKRKTDKLGTPDKKSDSERGSKNPNYYRLRQIPTGAGTNLGGESGLLSKRSETIGAAGVTDTEAKAIVAMMTKCAQAHERSTEDSLDLPTALSAFPKLAQAFVRDLQSNPKLAAYVQEFYSLLDFAVLDTPKTAADQEDIVIVSEVGQLGSDQLTDKQKEKVVAGGTAVVDKRPELKKSKVYRTEVKQQFTSATEGGLYDVLMADGSIEEFLIFKIASSEDMLAYELSSGRTCIIASQYLTTMTQHEPAEFRKRLEAEAVDADRVKAGDAATFVSQGGECSIPFVIDSAVSGANGIKTLKTSGRYYLPLGCGLTSGMGSPYRSGPIDRMNSARTVWRHEDVADRIKDIVVSDAGGGAIRYYEDRLAVNTRKFKALILNTQKKDDSDWPEWTRKADDATLKKSDFGTPDTILKEMEKISCPLKMWSEDSYLVIRDFTGHAETLGKVAALGHLVRKHGCTEDDALTMIKESTLAPTTWRVKYAAHLLDVADPQDEGESGPMSSYHPTQFKTHVIDKATSDDNRPFYQYHSPFAGNDDQQGDDDASPQKSMKAVTDAAETGQKEVFDAGVLGALVKSHNPTELCDRFLPTIVAGMDRLGRINFLLHWNFSEFEERYGDKDLSEFKDNIQTCFEQLGDLVLFMKKKTLSGDPESYGLGLSSTIDG